MIKKVSSIKTRNYHHVKDFVRTIIGLVEMARPFDGFIIGSAVVLGMAMGSLKAPPLNFSLLGMMMGILLLGGMDTLNDVKDQEADHISKPWRPIPSGRVPSMLALLAALTETLLGMMLALYLGLLVFILVVISILLAIAYSLWLKPYFLSKNILVSLSLSMSYLSGGLMTEKMSFSLEFWIVFLLIVIVSFCFEIHKDIADVEADKATNVTTIPTLLGEKMATFIASFGYLMAWIISAWLITANGITIFQSSALVLTALMGLVVVYLLVRDPIKHVETTRRIATALFGVMIFVLLDNYVPLLN